MFGRNELGQYMAEAYLEIAAAPENNGKTKAELKQIFIEKMRGFLLNEKQCVEPQTIVNLYQNYTNAIKSVEPKDRQARADRHNAALEAMVNASSETVPFTDGFPNIPEKCSRMERAIANLLKDEADKAKYYNCFAAMEEKYYNGKDKSKDEIAKEIDAATKEKNLISFNTIKGVVDKNHALFDSNISDDDLIANYTSIYKIISMVNESVKILDEIRNNMPEGVKPEDINEYSKKVSEMMTGAAALERRMFLMADPFYPDINLEALLTVELSDLFTFKNQIVQDSASIDFTDYANNRKDYLKLVEKVKDSEYSNIYFAQDNIFLMPDDIFFARDLAVASAITNYLGYESWEEAIKNITVFDKKGNIIDTGKGTSSTNLAANKGEFYIFDPKKSATPIPVVTDRTSGNLKILVGQEKINNSMPNTQKPSFGFMNYAKWLGFKIIHPLTAYKPRVEYNLKSDDYDRKVRLNNRGIPKAVVNAAKNAPVKVVKDNSKNIIQDAENEKIITTNIKKRDSAMNEEPKIEEKNVRDKSKSEEVNPITSKNGMINVSDAFADKLSQTLKKKSKYNYIRNELRCTKVALAYDKAVRESDEKTQSIIENMTANDIQKLEDEIKKKALSNSNDVAREVNKTADKAPEKKQIKKPKDGSFVMG